MSKPYFIKRSHDGALVQCSIFKEGLTRHDHMKNVNAPQGSILSFYGEN